MIRFAIPNQNLILFLVLYPLLIFSQPDFAVFDYWPHRPDPTRNLYEQITEVALSQLEHRKAEIRKIEGKQGWIKRQEQVREKLKHLLIPPFDKSPLNPVVTGKLQRDEFTVEKIYFEALPGYFVTAALFIPNHLDGPLPAILYCSGHTDSGFRSNVYQHMIINYVLKGFVVLAFDPVGQGERNQYFMEDGKKKFRPTHEHSFAGNQIFLNGFSPAQYFVWDGIRAIDYLVGRPEVDASRIGVTGRSGGGTQGAYLMAIDDRIKAAAPECYLTTFEQLLMSGGPQDAEQNILHFLAEGLDLADLVEVRAPAPTLMVTTTRDIFSIQGARDLYEEAATVYEVLGSPDHFSMIEDDAPHQSTLKNREKTYHFFQKFLDNPGDPSDIAVDVFSEEELWVTPDGQLFNNGQDVTLFDLNLSRIAQMDGASIEAGQKPFKGKILSDIIADLSGFISPQKFQKIFSGATRFEDFSMEKYLIEIHGDYHIPVIWMKPVQHTGKTILLLDESGKSAHTDSVDLIFNLVKRGNQVILADLSGYGEMKSGFRGDAHIDEIPLNIWYAGALSKRYPVAIRVEEILTVCDFIRASQESGQDLVAVAYEAAATDLLMACALGASFEAVALYQPLTSMESVLNSRDYLVKYIPSLIPGAIQFFDFPDLINQFVPMNLFIANPRSANGTPMDRHSVEGLYKDYPGELKLLVDEEESHVDQSILSWLDQF